MSALFRFAKLRHYILTLALLYRATNVMARKPTEKKTHGDSSQITFIEQSQHSKSSFLRGRELQSQNNTTASTRFDGEEAQSRIYGGTEVPVRRYPYLAGLFWTDPATGGLKLICGGTLIAPKVILTAAHCFDKIDVAMLGIYNFTSIQEADYEYYVISPDQKVIYPSYDPNTQANDFLLLMLDQPSNYYPITLNTKQFVPIDGQQLTVMGWGVTETMQQSTTPQETVVEAMTNSLCALRYGDASPIFKTELCAFKKNHDSCQGDSGGPLIIKGVSGSDDVLVGSVSWGYNCADKFYPGVYARVSSVKDWLVSLVPEARFDDSSF